jgi:hypothetical protein
MVPALSWRRVCCTLAFICVQFFVSPAVPADKAFLELEVSIPLGEERIAGPWSSPSTHPDRPWS